MDGPFFNSVVEGDVPAFLSFIHEDVDLIKQVVPGSLDTVLHLAVAHRHLELAGDIVYLMPELVFSVNEKLETPFHVAARVGTLDIFKFLLEIEPGAAFMLNRDGRSVLYVAYESGAHDVVNFLLENYPWMQMMMGRDAACTSLQAPGSRGHPDVLEDLAQKKDSQGWSHWFRTHMRDHLNMIRKPLRDPNMVQWATMKGPLSAVLPPAERITNHVLNLSPMGRKNWQSEDVKHSSEWTCNTPGLLNMRDGDGNLVTPYQLHNTNVYLLANAFTASVAYPAVINPPGGFEEFFGKAAMGKNASFIVFLVFNTMAFFTAISTVGLHVIGLHFEPKSMAKLSAISGKLTCMSLISLGAAYTASAWAILPKGPNTKWVLTAVASIGVGTIVGILLGLGKGKRKNNALNAAAAAVAAAGETQEKEMICDRGSRDSASTSGAGGQHCDY